MSEPLFTASGAFVRRRVNFFKRKLKPNRYRFAMSQCACRWQFPQIDLGTLSCIIVTLLAISNQEMAMRLDQKEKEEEEKVDVSDDDDDDDDDDDKKE
ncbi:unnamed protein product [Protopolystoma xenopodis]|uniref:Uncharacterized protein n=1 Tax=Protopolystoma xenopodis TaxID=117903 RepID=A0A3S5B9H2_9PLAT|nr:unnamed protein product [Protopolystoma xenopodis]